MLEAVVVFPFVAIVLVLAFELGSGFLARQRTLVAVREAGLRYVVASYRVEQSRLQLLHALPTREMAPGVRKGAQVSIATAVKDEIVDFRKTRRSAWPGAQPVKLRAASPVDRADFGAIASASRVFNSMVGTYAFGLQVEHRPVAGALIKRPVILTEPPRGGPPGVQFYVVGAPWNYAQYPDGLSSVLLQSLPRSRWLPF